MASRSTLKLHSRNKIPTTVLRSCKFGIRSMHALLGFRWIWRAGLFRIKGANYSWMKNHFFIPKVNFLQCLCTEKHYFGVFLTVMCFIAKQIWQSRHCFTTTWSLLRVRLITVFHYISLFSNILLKTPTKTCEW